MGLEIHKTVVSIIIKKKLGLFIYYIKIKYKLILKTFINFIALYIY